MANKALPLATLSPVHHGSELRVFISSTFRDLQPEREYLVKHVFPSIRQQCRERGLGFTEIDLRWGITERQARRGRIVRTCLDEIYLHKPYIITIIGNHYGWCPTFDDIASDPAVLHRYPWVAQSIEQRRSLVEMETLESLAHDSEMAGRIFVYIRSDSSDDNFSDPEVKEFLLRIGRAGVPIREGYSDPTTLGKWVSGDLSSLVDYIVPDKESESYLERERLGHDAFAATRCRAYVEHEPTLHALDSYVHEEPEGEDGVTIDGNEHHDPLPPMIVTGESGSGKSALLAYWSQQYRKRNPAAFILTHFVGATSLSTDHLCLLRRIMLEIKERYGYTDDVPTIPDEIESQFPLWLPRIQGEKFVLVIDAVNQLPEASYHMRWLPAHIPPQCRVIVSMVKGETLTVLKERGWQMLEVQPLSLPEREHVVRRYLKGYGKELEKEQLRRISLHPTSANPLFLRTSLEELRVDASFEELNRKIDYYIAAGDIDELFQRVVARIEEDHGSALVENVLTLLWGARRGLSEAELHALIRGPRLRISGVLLALEHHLMRRDGLLTFFHDHLHNAVEHRYLARPQAQKLIHRRLARFFARQFKVETDTLSENDDHDTLDDHSFAAPLDRIVTELPFQLQQCYAWSQLRGCLMAVPIVLKLLGAGRELELWGYWLVLDETGLLAERYVQTMHRYEAAGHDPRQVAELFSRIGEFLTDFGFATQSEELLRRSLELSEEISGKEHPDTMKVLDQLIESLVMQGRNAEAEPLCRTIVARYREQFGESHPRTLMTTGNLAAVYHNLGMYDEAEELNRRRLSINETVSGPESSAVANSLRDLAGIYMARADYWPAEELLRRSLSIWENRLGREDPTTALGYAELGVLYYKTGCYAKSEEFYRKALAVRERILGTDHPETALNYQNLGALYRTLARYDEAERLYRKALDAYTRLYSGHHPHLAITLHNLGALMVKQECIDAAEPMLESALELFKECFGPDHVHIAAVLNSIGDLRLAQHRCSEAQSLYERALEMYSAGYGAEHPATAGTLSRLGRQQLQQGDLVSAEHYLRHALKIYEAVGAQYSETAACMVDLAEVLCATGDSTTAHGYAARALRGFQSAFGDDHPRTHATRDLERRLRHQITDSAD